MKQTIRMAAVLAVVAMSLPALAQGGGQGGAGGGRQRGQGGAGGAGGGFGGGQRGGMMGGMMGGELTLASVPVKTLTTVLGLSDDQAAKVQAIQEKQRTGMQQMMQDMRQNFQGGGGDPAAMQEAMKEMRTKMTDANARAAREVEKVLTPEQATKAKASMRLWKIVQNMGLNLELADSLKLTEEQMTTLEKAYKERQAQMPGFGGRGGGGN